MNSEGGLETGPHIYIKSIDDEISPDITVLWQREETLRSTSNISGAIYAGVPTMDFVCVNNGAGGSVWTGRSPMATLVLSGSRSGTSWLPARQSFRGLGANLFEAPKSDTATWPEAWTSTCV